VAVADLKGDGIPDLVVTNLYSKDVSVLLGNGDGTFAAATDYPVGPYSQSGNDLTAVAVMDFNGDGKPDLAVAFGGGVRVFLGNGDGTFQTSASSYVAGDAPWGIAVGDFTGCISITKARSAATAVM
jgi:large repetitive protein